jgi:uncharacterized membrane protein YcaP (DUF421 family)
MTEENKMLQAVQEFFDTLLGLGTENLTLVQMLLRTVIVYTTALIIVRLGEKRFFGKSTAFDLVLSIILGSVISRAVNGGAPFFPTLAASLALVLVHQLLAVLAFHSDWFGDWVKGHARTLVEDGELNWDAMRESHLSEQDLRSALRVAGQVDDPQAVHVARLERSGEISVIPRQAGPQVIEYAVEEGVQTIRIEIRG